MRATYPISRAWPLLAVVLFLLLVIQSGILVPLLPGVSANLILLFGISIAVFSGVSELVLFALLGGILLDFASGMPDGIITLSLLLTFMCLSFFINTFVSKKERFWTLLFLLAVSATVLFNFFVYLSAWLLSILAIARPVPFISIFDQALAWEILVNLILIAPVYYFFSGYQWLAVKLSETK